ncbi:MAG: hypothetical protein ISR72_01970 [Methylobacter sp.]|nr:hypothetical protein [Methylobacter sp.]
MPFFTDLCTPKIRTGRFLIGSIFINSGDLMTVTTRDILGEYNLIPCQYAALADDVTAGDRILLDDGKSIKFANYYYACALMF